MPWFGQVLNQKKVDCVSGWRRSRVLQAQESSLSSRLRHWRIHVHRWVLCEAVPVVWRSIWLRRWSRRRQILYGHRPVQRFHVSGRLSLSEMEPGVWPTLELLRWKWRVQLRTASTQHRDYLPRPRIHVYTLPRMCHYLCLLWRSTRLQRLFRRVTLQPKTEHTWQPLPRGRVLVCGRNPMSAHNCSLRWHQTLPRWLWRNHRNMPKSWNVNFHE